MKAPETPQGLGLRQPSGALGLVAAHSKAPEGWRSPRRWRGIANYEPLVNNENFSRRDFIKRSGLVGAGITAAQMLPLRFLQAKTIEEVANPLAAYPNRD